MGKGQLEVKGTPVLLPLLSFLIQKSNWEYVEVTILR